MTMYYKFGDGSGVCPLRSDLSYIDSVVFYVTLAFRRIIIVVVCSGLGLASSPLFLCQNFDLKLT